MDKLELQILVEHQYSKQYVNGFILEDLEGSPEFVEERDRAVAILIDWLNAPNTWKGHLSRWQGVGMEPEQIKELVNKTMATVMLSDRPVTISSIAGVLAPQIDEGFSNVTNFWEDDSRKLVYAVLTCAGDLVRVCGEAGLVELIAPKDSPEAQWSVTATFELDKVTETKVARTRYLPPMVVEPKKLTNNEDSGYLEAHVPAMCGSAVKRHQDNINLAHLNRLNKTKLVIDTDLVKEVSATPTDFSELTGKKRKIAEDTEAEMIEIMYGTMTDLARTGNEFHMTHAVDNRGRTYCRGYHVNYQGSSFQKAAVNLSKAKHVEL